MMSYACIFLGMLSTFLFSESDTVSPGNPFFFPIHLSAAQGTIDTRNDPKYALTNYVWTFPTLPSDYMIYVALYGGYANDSLKIFGQKTTVLSKKYKNYNCFYFAQINQTDPRCRTKAEKVDKCKYLRTEKFHVTYESDVRPNFRLYYTFAQCFDISGTPATSTTTQAGGGQPTRQTSARPMSFSTTPINTNQTTEEDQEEQSDRKTIVIIVIVASILFAIIVLVLLFCGIRHRLFRQEIKAARAYQVQMQGEGATRPVNTYTATSPDQLYEEIVPALPARNAKMAEPQYETPIPSKYGRGGAGDYVTINNTLYEGMNGAENQGNEQITEEEKEPGTVDNVLYNGVA